MWQGLEALSFVHASFHLIKNLFNRPFYESRCFLGDWDVKHRTRKTNDPTTTKLLRNPEKFLFQQDLAQIQLSSNRLLNNFFNEVKRRVNERRVPPNVATLKRCG
jgi:hypothetical protein